MPTLFSTHTQTHNSTTPVHHWFRMFHEEYWKDTGWRFHARPERRDAMEELQPLSNCPQCVTAVHCVDGQHFVRASQNYTKKLGVVQAADVKERRQTGWPGSTASCWLYQWQADLAMEPSCQVRRSWGHILVRNASEYSEEAKQSWMSYIRRQ